MVLSTVKINCSLDWLMVSVIPLAESRNLYIFADELHLGMGCPANWIHTYVYEFIYLVHDCGIRTRVRRVIVCENTKCFVRLSCLILKLSFKNLILASRCSNLWADDHGISHYFSLNIGSFCVHRTLDHRFTDWLVN